MRLAVLAIAAALIPPLAAKAPESIAAPEPIVLLHGRTIAACGVQIKVELAGTPAVLDVMLERTVEGADLIARLSGPDMRDVERFSLTTASQRTDEIFAGEPKRLESGGREWRASAASAAVTAFVQELMVSGATLDVRLSGGQTGTFHIAGPMPQSVRAAYLNCAGDLYRPGE